MQGKITSGDKEIVIKEADTVIVIRVDPEAGTVEKVLNGNVMHMAVALAQLLKEQPNIGMCLAMVMSTESAGGLSKFTDMLRKDAEKEGEKHVQ